MRDSSLYERQIPERWAGKTLKDASLEEWLTDNFEARVIGRLVQGPAWEPLNLPQGEKKEEPQNDMPDGMYYRRAEGASGLGLSKKRTLDEMSHGVPERHTKRKQE